ncbi:ATP-binding protein [Pseudoflavonifractor sp. MSJ-37]|uniref:ATP-binding protein n=1 Tax=Pseudoflavonifractor sp. MSJ-37 TaxID=2841531 RepID=UPI001C11B49C|nr:transporter substrate-binding domain-containing protein [Pseudoflavonifractor sp. MSJ-37]MBU5435047.1 transporter substrate-binding domain-containing protein [Pseudoflavonifractor sp. MSJ-37]
MKVRVERHRWASALLAAVCLIGLLPKTAYAASGDRLRETVRVGWYEDSYHISGENGERSGYGYEYEQAVAAYTGWDYEYVKADWDELLERLRDGEIDLMAALSYTDERAETMLFSELPMGEERYYLYVDLRDGEITASDLDTLNGKRIIAMAQSVQDTEFSHWEEEHGITTQHIDVDSIDRARQMIADGEADGVISTETPIWVEAGMSALTMVGGSEIYYGINKDRPDLKKELDDAMRSMEYDKPFYGDELYQRYLSAQSAAVLSAEERGWLAEHGTIRMGFVDGDPGVSTIDAESGKVTGVIDDYIRYASDCLDGDTLCFEPVGYGSQEAQLEALRNGEIDMIFHVSQDPYLAEQNDLSLSNTVWSFNIAALTAQSGFDENAENSAAVARDDLVSKWYLSYHYPLWRIVEYDTQEDAERAVRGGRADCFIRRSSQVAKYIKDNKLHSASLLKQNDVSFAVRRGDTVLLAILNKTLKAMPSAILTGAVSVYDDAAYKITAVDFIKDNLLTITLAFVTVFLLILLLILGLLKKARQAASQAQDLNQRLRASQQKLREALAQAERANSAKTTFLSNMSHDIRTPMNAIVGLTGLMAREPRLSERLRAYIAKIQRSSQHLLSLINDVLDMSKIESGEAALNDEPVSLAEIVGQMDSIIRAQTNERGQSFQIRVHTVAHEYIWSDGLRLRQLLINLLSNATKYTPRGGSITFDLTERPCDRAGYASYRIVVADTGCGMEPEFQKHIFEPFTRAEDSQTNKVQGTGLGMAIAKNIVDLMGGTIRVESTPGKGSRFEVDLTFEIDRDMDQTTDLGSVLLISDDEGLRQNIAAAMREADAGFYAVATKEEAVERIGRQKMDIVLVGGHLTVPRLTETVDLVRGAAKDAVLIFFVDYIQPEQAEGVVSACRVDGVVPRPFFLSELQQTVEHIRCADTDEEERGSEFKGMRFLCAEDNDLNAEILEAVLDMNGASCVIYPNGKELVKAFAEARPGDYDAILMDVQMPVMNGLEAAKAIRGSGGLGETIPIIAMTANAFTEDIRQCLDAGMDAHVPKPLEISVLEQTLKSLIGRKFSGGGHLSALKKHRRMSSR